MTEVITKTQALPDGSMLWCVHHKGSYYDNDARAPGSVPVDVLSFVLAKGVVEAKQKASSLPAVKEALKRCQEDMVVEATIVTIESLVPARDSSGDGRMGWTSTTKLSSVGLSHPDDKGWKLAVCLIPAQ
jgi:hypothetical protein